MTPEERLKALHDIEVEKDLVLIEMNYWGQRMSELRTKAREILNG